MTYFKFVRKSAQEAVSNVKLNKGAIAFVTAMMALGIVLMATSNAHAGAGGTEFAPIYTLIEGWSQGSLGKLLALTMLLVGIVSGIARQSIMAGAVGLGAAVTVFYAPTVINTMVSAML